MAASIHPVALRSRSGHPAAPAAGGSAALTADGLVLADFLETDPVVLAALEGAEDVEAGAHHLLQVGARAVKAAQASLDTSLVERSFDALHRNMSDAVDGASRRVAEAAEALLDSDEGGLAAALGEWRSEVERMLGDTFDPDSKSSVLAKFEDVIGAIGREQLGQFRRLLDTTDPENPLSRVRGDLVSEFNAQRREITAAFNVLAQQVAVERKEAEVFERTAVKGAAYEEIVHEHLGRIVAPFGDVADPVGTEAGTDGARVGDEIVMVNPDDGGGCYVLEIKDRKVGHRRILDELDRAISNRDAAAGVAVFSCDEHSPCGAPFWTQGNRAVVVLDKADPDPAALRVACLWARWIATRETADVEGIDVRRIEELLDDARRSLKVASSIKAAHSKAKNGLRDAETHLGALTEALQDTIEAISSELV